METMTKAQMKESLEKANCPSELIERIGQDLSLWWKAGWIQEILLAQKKAGMEEVAEWVSKNSYGFDKGDGVGMVRKMMDDSWQAKLKEWELEV